MSDSWARSRARLAASSPCRPDQRAEKIPGMPPSTPTHRPESSATDGSPVNFAMARAFSSALSANVSPVSATSSAPGNSSSPVSSTGTPAATRIRRSSTTLWTFWVASTSRRAPGPPLSSSLTGKGIVLQPGQFAATGYGEIEQPAEHVPAERLALGRPLYLNEVAGAGADHIHVGLGG